jgi:hypothetical protein
MQILDDINIPHTDHTENGKRRITIQHVIITEIDEHEDDRLLELTVLQALTATSIKFMKDFNNFAKEMK